MRKNSKKVQLSEVAEVKFKTLQQLQSTDLVATESFANAVRGKVSSTPCFASLDDDNQSFYFYSGEMHKTQQEIAVELRYGEEFEPSIVIISRKLEEQGSCSHIAKRNNLLVIRAKKDVRISVEELKAVINRSLSNRLIFSDLNSQFEAEKKKVVSASVAGDILWKLKTSSGGELEAFESDLLSFLSNQSVDLDPSIKSENDSDNEQIDEILDLLRRDQMPLEAISNHVCWVEPFKNLCNWPVTFSCRSIAILFDHRFITWLFDYFDLCKKGKRISCFNPAIESNLWGIIEIDILEELLDMANYEEWSDDYSLSRCGDEGLLDGKRWKTFFKTRSEEELVRVFLKCFFSIAIKGLDDLKQWISASTNTKSSLLRRVIADHLRNLLPSDRILLELYTDSIREIEERSVGTSKTIREDNADEEMADMIVEKMMTRMGNSSGFDEGITPSQSKESNCTFFPTPPGTTWEDIKIQFRDNHKVTIWAGEETHMYTYGEMGMMSQKDKKPTKQWVWLDGFAQSNGKIDWKNRMADHALKKQKHELSKRLRNFFRIEDDPIVWDQGCYYCRFKILPEGAVDGC
ncbi:MAG: hypothetical protein V3V05_09875 [Pontiella sp.]